MAREGGAGASRRHRIAGFAKKHIVAVVACCAAAVSAVAVPPSEAYLGYFDVKTLCNLLSILCVVNALSRTGVFARAAMGVVRVFKTRRACVAALVGITLAGAMFITNDMALLTFLPLSYLVLRNVGGGSFCLGWCFILQNAAAVLGGMILPFGNPHNLYLYTLHEIPVEVFVATMLPTFATAVVLIAACCLVVKPIPLVVAGGSDGNAGSAAGAGSDGNAGDAGGYAGGAVAAAGSGSEGDAVAAAGGASEGGESSAGAGGAAGAAGIAPRKVRLGVFAIMFVAVLLSVLRVVPYLPVTAAVLVVTVVLDRAALKQVDYALLVTFAAFFVFAGNLSSIPQVSDFLVSMLAQNALFTTVCTCQIISNLPTTLLFAPFTGDWATLLVATDIGGMGTPIASLASLITIKTYLGYRPDGAGKFMKVFLAVGFTFLIVLCAVAAFTL